MSARQQWATAAPTKKPLRIEIHHDFETFCELDVRKVGAFRYAQHLSCDVVLLSWGTCDEDMRTWEPHLEPKMPKDLRALAEDPNVEFHAHNAQFEYCIWRYVMTRRYKAPRIAPERFVCTAVMCAAAGLPRSLMQAGMALELDTQKDKEGTRLINLFCKPQPARKPTKKNPDGVPAKRLYPSDRPEEWASFKQYNIDDVRTEILIPQAGVPRLSAIEQKYFALDLVMNERGLPLDMRAVRKAMPVVTELENRINREFTRITGGIRPTQVAKVLEHLNSLGLDLENMQAKTVKDILLLRKDELTTDQITLLQLRVEGGKASTKKLKTMLLVVCEDGRVRGGFLFYGAHTGRWSGKLIQPQNFTRGEYSPAQLERLIETLYMSDADIMEILYEWPVDAVAQGMRGFIRAPKGKKFVVCDFSAIEARVLAWLARQMDVLKIYEANGDVYIRMASKLYKRSEEELLRLVKVEKDKTATGQRKFAKDIVLGCGYQMGGPGFYNNCIKRGILVTEDECKAAVKVYRNEHPDIVKLWYDVERCAVQAVKQNATKDNPIKLRNLSFYVEGNWFCIRLPSGRPLRYFRPKLTSRERFGKMVTQLSYRSELKGKLIRETTYGGKLVENITQAVARDIMVESMYRAEKHGYPCIGTVHDELIAEVDEDFGSAEELEHIMNERPRWAKDAPIGSEGWEGRRYRK
jgi:DNA polymerase